MQYAPQFQYNIPEIKRILLAIWFNTIFACLLQNGEVLLNTAQYQDMRFICQLV